MSRKCETFRSLHLTELPCAQQRVRRERGEARMWSSAGSSSSIYISTSRCFYWLGLTMVQHFFLRKSMHAGDIWQLLWGVTQKYCSYTLFHKSYPNQRWNTSDWIQDSRKATVSDIKLIHYFMCFMFHYLLFIVVIFIVIRNPFTEGVRPYLKARFEAQCSVLMKPHTNR